MYIYPMEGSIAWTMPYLAIREGVRLMALMLGRVQTSEKVACNSKKF